MQDIWKRKAKSQNAVFDALLRIWNEMSPEERAKLVADARAASEASKWPSKESL